MKTSHARCRRPSSRRGRFGFRQAGPDARATGARHCGHDAAQGPHHLSVRRDRPDGIRTTTESNDPQVAKSALQQHAAEVTEFINDGMAAMHKAMMKNGGMMQRGMHGGTMATAPRGKTTPNLR
jgi:hypothetical protein